METEKKMEIIEWEIARNTNLARVCGELTKEPERAEVHIVIAEALKAGLEKLLC